MSNKIVKIIVFAVAILDCLIAVIFSFRFNGDKTDNYNQAMQIKANNPAMLLDLEAATPANLSQFIQKYQKNLSSYNDSLKAQQLQKDIFYTYIEDLKALDSKSFDQYKTDFPARSAQLFANCDKAKEYTEGFNNVKSFADLDAYVKSLEADYAVVKQNYLVKRDYYKAANSLVSQADAINTTPSINKKTTDLTTLQDDINSFNTNSSLQNVFTIIGYVLFFITVLMMLFFAGAKIVTNFKTSYKVLLVLLLFGVIFLIGYLIGSPDLSDSAVKAGMNATQYKLINACTFSLYITLLGAILAVIGTAIYGAVKSRR